jgi:acyl-CoA dehydrogenase
MTQRSPPPVTPSTPSPAGAYANERIVFDRPIGNNQAIQHPLAQRWMELEAANLMILKAAY